MSFLAWLLLGALILYVAMRLYLATVLRWEDEQTTGLKYFGRSREQREQFKQTLARHASLLSPVLWLSSRTSKLDFRRARIQYKGISAPPWSCSVESFQRAETYRPSPEDVFVVTQMKCGTTWMQQVVYEILQRGQGTLVDTGTAMHAVSPWLESRKSVPLAEAPLIGTERPSRIVKTHLPVALCPYNPNARFIYVTRHPAACFASCVDFVQMNFGALAPPLSSFEEWFCTKELMWWGTWTDHVLGWWRWSTEQRNVYVVHFEDMKRDLPGVIERVATFLDVRPLSTEEVASIVHKCGFAYMQSHESSFERQPPHILQAREGSRRVVSGSAARDRDVPEDLRLRVSSWAARELAHTGFPLSRVYPDVAAAG